MGLFIMTQLCLFMTHNITYLQKWHSEPIMLIYYTMIISIYVFAKWHNDPINEYVLHRVIRMWDNDLVTQLFLSVKHYDNY